MELAPISALSPALPACCVSLSSSVTFQPPVSAAVAPTGCVKLWSDHPVSHINFSDLRHLLAVSAHHPVSRSKPGHLRPQPCRLHKPPAIEDSKVRHAVKLAHITAMSPPAGSVHPRVSPSDPHYLLPFSLQAMQTGGPGGLQGPARGGAGAVRGHTVPVGAPVACRQGESLRRSARVATWSGKRDGNWQGGAGLSE